MAGWRGFGRLGGEGSTWYRSQDVCFDGKCCNWLRSKSAVYDLHLSEVENNMSAQLGRIIIYTKRTEALVEFYCTHFGFEVLRLKGDRIVELIPQGAGANILLYPMPEGRKEGQTLVKLVFDVKDVEGFCRDAKDRGLLFGSIHHADGYCFTNTKDPAKNSVSVSSRAFVER
jgi:predicted enzyme related to lactoylglutathione lyase